jgi:hypothetical protein
VPALCRLGRVYEEDRGGVQTPTGTNSAADVATVKLKHACFLGLCAGLALVALFPDGSLLGFLGAVLVFDAVVALLALLARSLIRPSESRRTTAKRAAVGVALILLVLIVVQRLRAPSDVTKIERTIATVATSSDPTYCDKLVTARYLEQTTSAKPPFADDFCRSEAAGPRADSTDVLGTRVDGDRATAVVAFEGGSYDGSRLELRLVEEGGRWKLDRILSFLRFNRGRFDRAFRSRLLEFGVPPGSVECVLGKAGQLTDGAVEHAMLGDSHRVFAPMTVECDRDGIERNLVSSIGNRKTGIPPAAVECAARRIGKAGDTRLVRLQLDLIAYNELILSCDSGAIVAYEKRELSAEGQGTETIECAVSKLQRLPQVDQIRLIYDETRYDELVQGCK